jgi:hypothetical protein
MLLFTSSSRNQIKKSMSDRPSQSSELTTISPKHTRLSNSDIATDNTNKKSSLTFHFFDSILPRSTHNKSIAIKIIEKKSPIESSSCPQTSLIPNSQLPEHARCLYNYNAIEHDEICVHRGEYVQILTVNQDNRWFVSRQANHTSKSIKGWLPGFVLGLKYPNKNISSSISSNNFNHL